MIRDEKQGTLPIWQPIGKSTHIISKRVSEKIGVKTAHTGTIDPMAEGVIIILLGENRHNKYDFAKWKKTYEFEVIFGIETDTYDGLGLITQIEKKHKKIGKKELVDTLLDFKGKYTQTVPAYSTIKIKGRSMHWYARNKKLDKVKLPTRSGEIFDIRLISLDEVSRETILDDVVGRVKKIEGDFRQDEIVKRWKNLMGSAQALFQIAKVYVEISKGLYVRSLSQDIAKKLGTVGFVYKLARISNGKYSKKECETLESLKLEI